MGGSSSPCTGESACCSSVMAWGISRARPSESSTSGLCLLSGASFLRSWAVATSCSRARCACVCGVRRASSIPSRSRHWRLGQLRLADESYAKPIGFDAINVDALRRPGLLLLATGRPPEAVEALQRAAMLLPADKTIAAELAAARAASRSRRGRSPRAWSGLVGEVACGPGPSAPFRGIGAAKRVGTTARGECEQR